MMENLRAQKGKVIALTRQIKKYDDGYAVQSQNSKRFYFVDNGGVCTCPDCPSHQSPPKNLFQEQCIKRKFAVVKKLWLKEYKGNPDTVRFR